MVAGKKARNSNFFKTPSTLRGHAFLFDADKNEPSYNAFCVYGVLKKFGS